MRDIQLFILLLKTLAWKAFSGCFYAVQRVIWMFSGTHAALVESRLRQNYQRSAQVLKIFARHRFDEHLPPCSALDFVATHELFDTPDRVLQDNVSLYKVTDDEAIFVEATAGSWVNIMQFPNFPNAQFRHAVRIIRMPISSFHRIADQLGDPDNLTFIGITTRCGSTLLNQMLKNTGHLVVITQPPALYHLFLRADETGDEAARRSIVDSVRLLMKPTSLKERGHVLKVLSDNMCHMPMLTSQFPRAKCIFIYRDGLKVTQSRCRLYQELPARALSLFEKKYKARLHWLIGALFRTPKTQNTKWTGMLAICAVKWATNLRLYLEFREAGLTIVGVRYEDIVADPETNMRRILRYCDLPEQLAVNAVRALNVDSQLNTALSTTKLRRHQVPEYSGAARAEVEEVCDYYGLPRFTGIPYIAPGTITLGAETGS